MKWTPEKKEELRRLCKQGELDNKGLATHFGVPTTEIYAQRSAMGITIAKCRAAATVDPKFESASAEMDAKLALSGLETFRNAGEACIVLARSGDTALIVRPENGCCPFVVPLQHKPGASDWWQGNYFGSLAKAWAYYTEAIK